MTKQRLHLRFWYAAALLATVSAGACGGSDAPPPEEADSGAGHDGDAHDGADTSATSDAAAPIEAGDARADADASLLSPTFVHRDLNHVLATGQSLSLGSGGAPPLTTVQPYANVSFNTGVMAGAVGLTSFIPLVEGDLLANVPVETMYSSLANLVTKEARERILVGQPAGRTSHDLLFSAHGIGGREYAVLKKGGTEPAYATGIAQAQAGYDLAVAANRSFVVRAVTNVHGEADQRLLNASYEANLIEWQANYEADVRAITGQADPVPMFHTQISGWTKSLGKPTTSIIAPAQLAAHVSAPGKVILVGAKYHLPYVADGVHLTNEGYRHMGEDYAKAYRRVILEGKPWEPVRPRKITRAGAVVTVQMHVPAPPLVIDTTLVTDPGSYGFEWTDDGPNVPTIASVVVSGPDTVVVTLSAPPNANGRVRYAFTGVSDARGGPTTGPRGNLRDSDATPSLNGYALYNWCVHFDAPSP